MLGLTAEQRVEWREALVQLLSDTEVNGATQLVALVEAVIALLDAGGNPTGLGGDLQGPFAATWQAIIHPEQ